jgi:zinc D-Ala-D-Ala carboxypeptidase
MTQLSKNFSLGELCKSEVAIRRNIDNTPSEKVKNNLQILVDNVLQPLRDKFGPMTVTSGYRSPAVNTAVGGSPYSDHCLGMAADIEIVGVDNKVLAEYIRDNMKFTQLILEFYTDGVPDSGWVHVSYDEKDLKCNVLRAVKENGKTIYHKGI